MNIMKLQIKLVFLFIVFICHGCKIQPHQKQPPVFPFESEQKEQKQIYSLFVQGMKYQDLSRVQQQAECDILKKSYQKTFDWQTGWLLVFLSDEKFTCIGLNEKLKLMKFVIKKKNSLLPLYWLNENQIYLLNTIDELGRKNIKLKHNLKEANINLDEMSSKIEALKAIENGINQKLDRPQENEK